MKDLSERDLKVLNRLKEGNELSGFEGLHTNLVKIGYLDYDLELTVKEICWKLLENIVEEEHLKNPKDSYKEDFENWFKNNAKPQQIK